MPLILDLRSVKEGTHLDGIFKYNIVRKTTKEKTNISCALCWTAPSEGMLDDALRVHHLFYGSLGGTEERETIYSGNSSNGIFVHWMFLVCGKFPQVLFFRVNF